MSRPGKIISWIGGIVALLIVVIVVIIATFDWNRLKPTINEKVSAELQRPFAIRGDLGVAWARNRDEAGCAAGCRGRISMPKMSCWATRRISPI